jgi:hypothetical protein
MPVSRNVVFYVFLFLLDYLLVGRASWSGSGYFINFKKKLVIALGLLREV